MRKAALLYNPDSGGSRPQRQAGLEPVLAALRQAGVETELLLTNSAAHAREQMRQAMQHGCDTVFACGGDGTVHNLVQVLAGSPVALGVLPMGTANALAHDMGLPNSLRRAALAAIQGTPQKVALGQVEYVDFEGKPGRRYFVVAAGMGVDAHLFYKLLTASKQRMGMGAYYAKAWHLWFTYAMSRFQVEYVETGSTKPKRANATELMAVRIRNFGGVLRELAPGASLERNDVRLVICRTASRSSFLLYVMRGLLGLRWKIPGIDLADSTQVTCDYLPQLPAQSPAPSSGSQSVDTPSVMASAQPKIYVEADGELVGTLPGRISIAREALTLLMPGR